MAKLSDATIRSVLTHLAANVGDADQFVVTRGADGSVSVASINQAGWSIPVANGPTFRWIQAGPVVQNSPNAAKWEPVYFIEASTEAVGGESPSHT